jgi:hypothetical protein
MKISGRYLPRLKAGVTGFLLLICGCESVEPKYFFKGQEVVPVLEWCEPNNVCFQSVDPVINGQPDESARMVVKANELEVRQ